MFHIKYKFIRVLDRHAVDMYVLKYAECTEQREHSAFRHHVGAHARTADHELRFRQFALQVAHRSSDFQVISMS
jgi:hypothetical protein